MKTIKILSYSIILAIVFLIPSQGVIAQTKTPQTRGTGTGVAVTFLDKMDRPDAVTAWTEIVQSGKGLKTGARYQVLYNLDAKGTASGVGKVLTVPGIERGDLGVGLAAGKIDEKKTPDFVYAWAAKVGGKTRLYYITGLNMDENGNAAWGSINLVPDEAGELFAGLGASLWDVDRNGKTDLILGWAKSLGKGYEGKYRIGYDIGDSGKTSRWGPVLSLPGGPIQIGGWGIGLTCINAGGKPGPELIFSWVRPGKATPLLAYRIGRNLSPEGKSEEWSGDMGDHPMSNVKPRGAGLCAGRLDRGHPLDLLYGWVENDKKGCRIRVACAGNPSITPAFTPTDKDFETVGDGPTGFSRAAVRAQITAGMYSPRFLVEHADQYVKDHKSVDELVKMIDLALDAIRPPVPEKVKPELEQYLLKYYGVRKGVGL